MTERNPLPRWLPIETAQEIKKNGTRVLFYQPGGDGEDESRTVAEGSWGHSPHHGWLWCMEGGDGWSGPTHWMPLPEGPA